MPVPQKSIFDSLSQSELFDKINDICGVVDFIETAPMLLQVTLHKLTALFGAARGSVFTLNKKTNELVLAASVGLAGTEQEAMVKRMGAGIVGKVAQEKCPIVVEDIGRDVRFANFKARKSYATPSFLCVPMMVKDDLLGVITISDKKSGVHFNINEMQLLDFLSSQVALSCRRIQLYEMFQQSIHEAESLKDELGKTGREAEHLKKQIYIQERLATLGKLAGGIAHEFNNPLDGVMRYTNLSLEHTQDEVVRGYLLEIKAGLDRMAGIVRNLLACTRNQAQGRDRVDVNAALDYALAGLKTEIAHKNITVEREIEENIPSVVDLGLEGIMTNLLRNACDAIDDGGVIRVQAKYVERILTVIISDTGRGIPKGDPNQIFEPFFTTKAMEKGCGLGLTIVAEIIKSYEGKIHVESRPGEGTVFTINLPVKE